MNWSILNLAWSAFVTVTNWRSDSNILFVRTFALSFKPFAIASVRLYRENKLFEFVRSLKCNHPVTVFQISAVIELQRRYYALPNLIGVINFVHNITSPVRQHMSIVSLKSAVGFIGNQPSVELPTLFKCLSAGVDESYYRINSFYELDSFRFCNFWPIR